MPAFSNLASYEYSARARGRSLLILKKKKNNIRLYPSLCLQANMRFVAFLARSGSTLSFILATAAAEVLPVEHEGRERGRRPADERRRGPPRLPAIGVEPSLDEGSRFRLNC